MSSAIPSLIPTIVLVGNTNVGKSSLLNLLSNQDSAIVSDIAGTTTDEVVKRMELLDVGPVNLIDTAGINDITSLNNQRLIKTNKAIQRASLILYVCDYDNFDLAYYNNIKENKLLIFNKIDLMSNLQLEKLKKEYPMAIFINTKEDVYRDVILNKLKLVLKKDDEYLLSNIPLKFKKIIHVIPIDDAAPKGRLILPQMQLIRECLDRGIISIVLQVEQLADYLSKTNDIDLIVTDSQIFNKVSSINKRRFKLTSYSILQANQKGDLKYFVNSIKSLENTKLKKILMMESCSHNISHDDIGRVKIPKMLQELLNNDIEFTFKMTYDFELSEDIDLIVHCGSCMLSKAIMSKRVEMAKEHQIPLTNYGLVIAYYFGILDEAIEIFNI